MEKMKEIVIYILQHMNRDQIKLQSHLEGRKLYVDKFTMWFISLDTPRTFMWR